MPLAGLHDPDVPSGLTVAAATLVHRIGATTVALAGHVEPEQGLGRTLGLARDASRGTVLTAAVERLGAAAVRHLRGRFALVAWDGERRSGFLATDPLGTLSVFFRAPDRRLRFGGDVRDVLGDDAPLAGPDSAAVARWVAEGTLGPQQTLFAGIRRLPGGHVLTFDASGWTMARYWMPSPTPPLRERGAELEAMIRSELARATGDRLEQGRTAVLLSGGLDSAVVAAAAKSASGEAPSPYTFSFPQHETTDESMYVAAVCELLGTTPRTVAFGPGSALGAALAYLDRWRVPPLPPTLFFGVPTLAHAAEDGNTVALDGEGGDELFGCDLYLIADRARRARLWSASRLVHLIPGRPVRVPPRLLLRALWSFGLRPALPHAAGRALATLREPARPQLLRPAPAKLYSDQRDAWAWTAYDGPRWWAQKAFRLTQWREELGAHDFLRHRAELAGIRSAHPLLDDVDLVTFSLRLPPELSFDPVYTRPLLRRAMGPLLPDLVLRRPTKTDFGAVVREALTGPDWPTIERLLGAPDARIAEFAEPEPVRRLLAAGAVRDGAWGWQLWRLLMLECWLRSLEDVRFVTSLRAS
jgi:asparagine synthase (glutamine-hydrolysing)